MHKLTEAAKAWNLRIPFVSFGAVTSENLFDEKEHDLFRFYAANSRRYHSALDIGANIGVHTILMARAGWRVMAFEPDPDHFSQATENITENLHGFRGVQIALAAVSTETRKETFVRVKGNTTGSHLKGDKNPYGELEEFEVQTVNCRRLFRQYDFAKIDCEGHEARLLLTMQPQQRIEMMVEVGSVKNADLIFNHMRLIKKKMWAQKRGWQEVQFRKDMPEHHSEGSLFIGASAPFPAPELPASHGLAPVNAGHSNGGGNP